MSGLEVVWEDPPEVKKRKRGPGHKTSEFAAVLRDNPNRWALWPDPVARTTVSGHAARINRGDYPALPKGEFEATSRVAGGIPKLYVRFVGEASS